MIDKNEKTATEVGLTQPSWKIPAKKVVINGVDVMRQKEVKPMRSGYRRDSDKSYPSVF